MARSHRRRQMGRRPRKAMRRRRVSHRGVSHRPASGPRRYRTGEVMLEIASTFHPGKPVKPIRNPRFLAFIRRFPCIVCAATQMIEACHFGKHGISQKASDEDALPLCHECHMTRKNSYHRLGPVQFALLNDLDVPALQSLFQGWWEKRVA
jgi:hypothetical protein